MTSQPDATINRRLLALFDAAAESRADLALWTHHSADALSSLRHWAAVNGYAVKEVRTAHDVTVHIVAPHGLSGNSIQVYERAVAEVA
jgi:hypothetical protein